MPTPIAIRVEKGEDAASMVELLNPIIEAGCYTIMDEPVTTADQADFIRAFPDRGVFHVAVCVDSGRIVGMQDVMPISDERPRRCPRRRRPAVACSWASSPLSLASGGRGADKKSGARHLRGAGHLLRASGRILDLDGGPCRIADGNLLPMCSSPR